MKNSIQQKFKRKNNLLNPILLFSIISVFSFGKAFTQTPNIFEVKNKADYPFLLYLPEKDTNNKKPPVIIFLHGKSLSGTDLNLVRKYGTIFAIERGKKIPAIVIAPQVNRPFSWSAEKVFSVLEYVQANYETDLTRVYVMGMSMGGGGTYRFAGSYPSRIAAAVALCGNANLSYACGIAKTNIWIKHGEKDVATLPSESKTMYKAIKACEPKGVCEMTLIPNWGHRELAREFNNDTIYNWAFSFQNTDTVGVAQELKEKLEKGLIKRKEE